MNRRERYKFICVSKKNKKKNYSTGVMNKVCLSFEGPSGKGLNYNLSSIRNKDLERASLGYFGDW